MLSHFSSTGKGGNVSFGQGVLYDKKRTELYVSGSNQEWYSFKNALCEHMSCSSVRNGGQFHMKSLQHMFKMKRINARNDAVHINLVSAGIEVCKMKAAALQFESMIALLSFCQADVGDIGHGRYCTGLLTLYISDIKNEYIKVSF